MTGTPDMNNFKTALTEIEGGEKKLHWIWYIIPSNLSPSSANATFFKIDTISDDKGSLTAEQYLSNDFLRKNYITIINAIYKQYINKYTELLTKGGDVNVSKQIEILKKIMRSDIDYNKLINSIGILYPVLIRKYSDESGVQTGEDDINIKNFVNNILVDFDVNLKKIVDGLSKAAAPAPVPPSMVVSEVYLKGDDLDTYKKIQDKCSKLKTYNDEIAYKLAEQLIPLEEKIEINKLEIKNKYVEEHYPTNTINYNPVEITTGFTRIVEQESLNCGRAALVNFFGNDKELLIKGDPLNSTTIFNLNIERPKTNIDMGAICNLNKTYYDIFNDKVGNKQERLKDEKNNACPDNEEYSYQVLTFVLNILGYNNTEFIFSYDEKNVYGGTKSDNKDNYFDSAFTPKLEELLQTVNDPKYLGYLVNLGRGHWICYKRMYLNTTNDVFYRINSFNSNIRDSRPLKKLIEYENNNTNLYVFAIYQNKTNNLDIFTKLTRINNKKKYYYERLVSNKLDYEWKKFIKNITSKLIEITEYKSTEKRIQIMAYIKLIPNDIISNDIKQKIISLPDVKQKMVVEIFANNIKQNINLLDKIQIIKETNNYIEKNEVEICITTFKATDRFLYNLNNTDTYNNKLTDGITTIDKLLNLKITVDVKKNIKNPEAPYYKAIEKLKTELTTRLNQAGGSNTIPPKSKPNPIPISKSTIKITSNKKPNKRTKTRKHANKITHKLKDSINATTTTTKNKKKTRKHIHKNTVIAR